MYSIKLADGTVIDNVELNGNNYIPEKLVDVNMFTNENLSKVIITDGDNNNEELNNIKVMFATVNRKQSFIFIEKTIDELKTDELNQLLADLTETVLLSQGGM